MATKEARQQEATANAARIVCRGDSPFTTACAPHVPTAHEVETFSGQYVNTQWPDPRTIVLEDIAHALAATCRYGGHCKRFYSVAEHAVLCSVRLERYGHSRSDCLAALHHDDAEAYLGDIPRPLKPLLGRSYETLTNRMNAAICNGLDLPFKRAELHEEYVKAVDAWALFLEARHLLPSGGINWAGSALDSWGMAGAQREAADHTPDYWRGGLKPSAAEGLYLSRHWELTS